MRPVIGVFPQYDAERRRLFLTEPYVKSICRAGGEPRLLLDEEPCIEDGVNGYLFPGGPDIAPHYFGEETMIGCGTICPRRDRTELGALRRLCECGKPILGICRGLQVMNVALGGTLYQDMQHLTKQQHYQISGDDVTVHRVHLEEKTLLRRILGEEEIYTNSFHHQCIKELAVCLRASGRTADGVIEAVELIGHPFFVGVQWHPEHLTGGHVHADRLFREFVRYCGCIEGE